MAYHLFHVLAVLLCCTTLVLPAGWCCQVPDGCCGRPLPQSAEEAPEPCCCCHTHDSDKPASHPPTKEHGPPVKSCCESHPSVLRTADTDDHATPMPAMLLPPAVAAVAAPVHVVPGERHTIISPPLHLLHSVWLC